MSKPIFSVILLSGPSLEQARASVLQQNIAADLIEILEAEHLVEGLRRCQGAFACVLPSGSVLLPFALQRAAAALSKYPQADLLAWEPHYYLEMQRLYVCMRSFQEVVPLQQQPFYPSCTLMRRSLFQSIDDLMALPKKAHAAYWLDRPLSLQTGLPDSLRSVPQPHLRLQPHADGHSSWLCINARTAAIHDLAKAIRVVSSMVY